MTFEEALIEHCSPHSGWGKARQPVPLLSQGQRPFRAPVPCAPATVRRPGTAAGHPQGLPPHGLLPALPVPGAGSGGGAGPQRAPGFSARYGLPPWEAPGDCLRQLAARLCLEEEFPHEIGVFLGYPLDDVKGFIRHKGRDYTFCGCWKCYGDPQAARRRFERYRRCTAVLRRRYAEGTPITQLIVAA